VDLGMKLIETICNESDRRPPNYDLAQLLDSNTYRSIGMNPILRKTCMQVSEDVISRDNFEDILGDIMEMDTSKQSSIIAGTYPPASLSTSRFIIFNSPNISNGSITQQPSSVSDRSLKSFLDVLSTSYSGTQRGDSNAGVKLNCSLISFKSGTVQYHSSNSSKEDVITTDVMHPMM